MQDQVILNRFRLIKKLGEGAFGQIWTALDSSTNQKVAIKMERIKCEQPQLLTESKIYKLLQSSSFPKLLTFSPCEDIGQNTMAMELLGPSLDDLFAKLNRKFSIKTVCMLMDQMITRVQYLHKKKFIHRDQKPDNYCIGLGRRKHLVMLIDYGMSKRYILDNTHIPQKTGKKLTGTVRFVSVNTHLGYEQSRRDDLEALGYIAVYFLKGALPWQGIQEKNLVRRIQLVMEMKGGTTVEQLCHGLPEELIAYLKYVKSLIYDQEPNYHYLKELFRNVLKKLGLVNDFIFDWNEQGIDTDRFFEKKGDEKKGDEIEVVEQKDETNRAVKLQSERKTGGKSEAFKLDADVDEEEILNKEEQDFALERKPEIKQNNVQEQLVEQVTNQMNVDEGNLESAHNLVPQESVIQMTMQKSVQQLEPANELINIKAERFVEVVDPE